MSALPPESTFDPAWSTAVPDWRERILERRSMIPDLPLFAAYADKALAIFKRLRVPDLIGTPTFGDVCEQWVFDFVRAVFGAYNPETRQRKIREYFLLVPKKNSKSTLAAGILVTAMILNVRPLAEAALIAPTQEVAAISFGQARGIIKADPELDTLFHVKDHEKSIIHRITLARLKIISADGDVVTGGKWAYVLIDETHVLASKQKAAGIFLELRGGLASRPEGFLLQITTQSKTPPAGQFRKELQRARDVRDGRVQRPYLAVLYELPQDMQQAGAWKDIATWALVNPNMDRSVSLEYLEDQWLTAQQSGPEDMMLFASQHLNVQIGMGLQTDLWVGAQSWAQNGKPMTLTEFLDRCEVVVIGGDVGGADDLFALALMGRERDTRRKLVWVRAWCHRNVLTLRQEIAPLLEDFAADGDLVITDSTEVQAVQAADLCEMVRAAGLLPEERAIGLDPYGAAALSDELSLRGFEVNREIIGVGQGYRLSGAIKGMERLLLDGNLIHAEQPMVNWSVTNARAEERGNNILITKAVAGSAKIDPLIAIINAAVLMDMNPTIKARSFWETPTA